MKILQVKLHNLNSLQGEHTIDLAGDPLGSAGIFAITGPTGSGKSTLLDAITLALYGRAARYGSSPNPEDMMSRHTGECSAEVIFQVSSGIYRAEWQLRKARGKADGRLQAAKRYLYDSAGVVLAEQLKEADRVVEELSGLNYERFMRSVLLAQGEFARFLRAKSDERAQLLESLTGTAIYSELSALTHQEVTRRHHELQAREREMGLIELLSEEEQEERRTEIQGLDPKIKTDAKERDQHAAVITRSAEFGAQLENEKRILKSQEELKGRQDAALDDLAKLALHQKAVPFRMMLDRVDSVEKEVNLRVGDRKGAEGLLVRAGKAQMIGIHAAAGLADQLLEEKNNLLGKREKDVERHQLTQKVAESWLRENARDKELSAGFSELVETLTKLKGARKVRKDLEEDGKRLKHEISGEEKRSGKFRIELANQKKAFAACEKAMAAASSTLEEVLAGQNAEKIREEGNALRKRSQAINELMGMEGRRLEEGVKLGRAQKHLGELAEQEGKHQSELKRAEADHEKISKLLKSYQDHLVTAQRVASLEEQRAILVEGEPCPLCGAEEHPYASGEEKPPALKELEAKINAAREDAVKAERVVRSATAAVTKTEAETVSLRERKQDAIDEVTKLEGVIANLAKPLEIADTDKASLASMVDDNDQAIEKLDERLKRIDKVAAAVTMAEKSETLAQSKVAKAEADEKNSVAAIAKLKARDGDLVKRASAFDSELLKICRITETLLSLFECEVPAEGEEAELQQALELRKNSYLTKQEEQLKAINLEKEAKNLVNETKKERDAASLIQKRLSLKRDATQFGDQEVPVDEIGSLLESWHSMEEAELGLTKLQRGIDQAETALGERTKAEESAVKKNEEVQEKLSEGLKTSEFDDVASLRDSLLEEDEEKVLTELKKGLELSKNELATKLSSTRETLARLKKEKTASGENLEKIKTKKAELDEGLQVMVGRRATLKNDLDRNDKNRNKQAKQEAALKQDRDMMKSWDLLHALIGSGDGRKFRRFAQGISLDVLVRHANRHLERLSERYQLRRTEGQELELEIVDLFQAGVSRPMSSLSGGESFLASLALALGLSDLAGRNVQIDSLFIDEGFGSLDPETLDVALSALEILRLSNKTVGVISHVELLKERISTQIEVRRLPGGRSQLKVLPETA
ncbi:AAA family ATPase [Haloferula sp.]|uniref:AAA family ATPase n=1 Tax=Haloferula sp. TaxID=2497595 RepID=UPI00329C5808